MSKKKNSSKRAKKSKDNEQQSDGTKLPGWPGYRTREGRSGYDPIDTRTEAAHTAGTLIQKLVTGSIKNPVYLLLLGLLGILLVTPLVLAVVEMLNGDALPWNAWVFILITGIAGAAILFNFIRNLIARFFR